MKYVLLISSLISSCQNTDDPLYTKLHENIYQINNQYFYGEKVHTYLIELPDKVLLFDIPTFTEELKAFILSFEKSAFAIISHGSCGIADGTRWQNEIQLQVYAHQADEDHPWIRMEPDVLFSAMPEFDPTITVIHTPGHSAGSICVLETNSESLFTGDTFYATASGSIRDFTKERQAEYENLEDRIDSCKELLKYDFEYVYPFHYEAIGGEGKQKLAQFLEKI